MAKFAKRMANQMITPLILCFFTFAIHQQVQACGGEYTSPSGLLSSPLYPSQYPPDQDCVYIIKATAGYRITLTFLRFELEGDITNCQNDYIQIRDGGSGASPSLGIFCNTTAYTRRSTSNTMWIRFRSDSSQSAAGFHVSYTTAIIPQKFLLVTASVLSGYLEISNIDIDTYSLIDIPLSGLQDPAGVDYDPMNGRIYWTDNGEKTIRSAKLDGSDVRLVRYLGFDAVPDGLCVDSLSRLIFYTDAGNKVIGMITMDSNSHRIVINSSLDKPKDIELDKHNGVMYWSDRGASPTIERANFDGTGRQTLVSGGEYLNQPNGLALDTVGARADGRLYWADGGTQKVGWVDLEGRKTSVILQQPGSVFYGMDLYLSEFFVTDWGFLNLNQTVKTRLDRYGKDGGNGRTVANSRARLNDIRVYSEEIEDKEPNGCGSNNGGCSYICIPTPGNRSKCITEDGGAPKSESTTTGSSTKARDLVTPSSTRDPTIPTEAESVSTSPKIIIAVCVVAAVVGIAVIIALIIFFKLKRQSNRKEHVAFTRGHNQPKVTLESPTATSNTISAADDEDINHMSQSGYREDNSNDEGETSCKHPEIFTLKELFPYITMEEQSATHTGDYSNSTYKEEHLYDDLYSHH